MHQPHLFFPCIGLGISGAVEPVVSLESAEILDPPLLHGLGGILELSIGSGTAQGVTSDTCATG